VFACLCVPGEPVPDDRLRGYIDETVEYRNAVAHGRMSPLEVGRQKTSDDIARSLDAIAQVVEHVVTRFDDLLMNRRFVNPSHRTLFPASARTQSATT